MEPSAHIPSLGGVSVSVAVEMVPLVFKTGEPVQLVLALQFRPAIGSVCVEFPGGLVDPREDAQAAALRELREETGYTGTVVAESALGVLVMNAGLSNTDARVIVVRVRLFAPTLALAGCEGSWAWPRRTDACAHTHSVLPRCGLVGRW